MYINKSIFRESDIRGVAGLEFDAEVVKEYEKWYGKFPGTTINEDTAEAIGKAYGTLIKRKGGSKVIVGYEVRPYAEELKAAFINGITATGVNVDDAGKATTPLIYFFTSYHNYDGGVNITGSHNVYFYNGFKLMGKSTSPIYGDELQKMRVMIEADDFDIEDQRGSVSVADNLYTIYKEYVTQLVKVEKKFRVVVDCGNGTPGMYAVDFLETIGCEVVEGLYLEPDARFPNHIPDPESPKNMAELMTKVLETKADLGIAFDADGDRCGFVTNNGDFVYADDILLFLAKDVLTRFPQKKILFDVKCSELLFDLIPEYNGIPLMHKTGHGSIKDTLRKDPEVILGGEISGHFYFVENYFKIDDGFFAVAQVLQLLSVYEGTFADLVATLPKKVKTPEIKLPCVDEVKFRVVEQAKEALTGKYQRIDETDGIRVYLDDVTWGLVRASDTSPYLTLRFEGNSEERVLELKNIFADILEQFNEVRDKLNRKEVFSLTGVLGYV